jgi:SAM-dependent methyltransferase
MSDWFRDTFGEEYAQLYAHRDEREAAQMVDLIERGTPARPGARVLDAPCGTGRHARIFAGRGYRVWGLDLSVPLLRLALAGGGGITYVRGDIRQLPFRPESFDLVVNLFSSFGYFETDEENAAVFAEFARVCARGGYFVFDFFNEQHLRAQLVPQTHRRTPDGWVVRELRTISGSPERVRKQIHIETASGETRELVESVRLFTRHDIETMMTLNGFGVEEAFGDYAGSPFEASSPRLLLKARRV